VADDLGSQLGIQSEINKVLVAREAIMKRNASLLQGQAQLAKELCNALRCENLDGMEERLKGIRDAMEDASNAAREASGEFDDLNDELGKMVDGLDDASSSSKKLGKSLDVLGGIASGFKLVAGSITGAFSAVFNVVRGVTGLVSSAFGAMVQAANDAAASGRDMAEAFEDVREEFGDLATGEGLAVTEAFRDVDKAANEAGVNLGSRFGPFVEGSVAKLKAMAAAMGNLGDLGPLLEKQFTGRVAFAMDSLSKGAGISGEAFQSLANRSLNSGQTLEGVMEQTSRSIASVAKGIGVSTKTLGKSFDAIAKDVTNFGHLTVQEMTSLAAVMTKTGISMATVSGIASKFDQFDSAAESVAKLTQAFGLNLNAVDLLNASDEERLQMLKSSFLEQGKSIDQLSRQERQYLAQAAGIAESDLERVFGDQAGSIDETATAAERAQEAQISMAASMKEMEKSIKRIFGPLLQLSGFFSSFFDGVDKGFKESGKNPFRPLYEAMREVFSIGQQVGRIIAELIDKAGGLENVLDLEAMKAPFKFILTFFEDLKAGKGFDVAFGDLLDSMLTHAEERITKFVPFMNKVVQKMLDVLNDPAVQTMLTDAFTKLLATAQKIVSDPAVQAGLQATAKGLVAILVGSLGFNLALALPGAFLQGISWALGGVAARLGGAALKKAAGKIGPKLATFLVPGYGQILALIVAGITAAFSASDIENRIGSEIDSTFSDPLANSGAKLATTFLNAITLGLLPDDLLTGMAKFFGNIGQSISDLLDYLGLTNFKIRVERALGGIFAAFKGLGTFLGSFFDPSNKSFMDAFTGAEDLGQGLVEAIFSAMSGLNALFMDVLWGILGLIGKVFTIENVKAAAIGLLKGFGKLFLGIGGLISGILKGIYSSIELEFKTYINSLIDTVNSIPGIQTLMGGPIEKFDLSKIESVTSKAAENAASVQANAAAAAKAVVESTNETTEAVRAIGESGTDAAVALDDFIKGTSNGANKITVDREKIQFAINLNVNLVADKLAEALSDKAIVSEDFVLTRAGGGVTPSTA